MITFNLEIATLVKLDESIPRYQDFIHITAISDKPETKGEIGNLLVRQHGNMPAASKTLKPNYPLPRKYGLKPEVSCEMVSLAVTDAMNTVNWLNNKYGTSKESSVQKFHTERMKMFEDTERLMADMLSNQGFHQQCVSLKENLAKHQVFGELPGSKLRAAFNKFSDKMTEDHDHSVDLLTEHKNIKDAAEEYGDEWGDFA